MGRMSFVARIPLLLLLLLSFFITLSTADIKSLTLTSDTRSMILIEKFGFSKTGHVDIAVSDVSVEAVTSVDMNLLGFFLLNEDALLQVLIENQQNPNFCFLDSHYITRLFTFRDLSLSHSFNNTFPVVTPGEYAFFFCNCVPESSVSMSLHAQLFNTDPNGIRNYLSVGKTLLPYLFFLFSIAYFIFLFFWVYLCYSNQHSLHWIHNLMTSLLIMKTFSMFCAAVVNHYVQFTGTSLRGWDFLLSIFHALDVVLQFAVVVLVGTGWPFLKPFLQGRGKKVLVVVLPLQVLASVVAIFLSKSGPFREDWVTWNQVLLLVDFISCCVVIFLFVWSMRSLKATAWKNVDGFFRVRQFYVIAIGYLVFPRLLLYVFVMSVVSYKYQWVSNLAQESAGLAFYLVMFYIFRPVEKDLQCDLLIHEEEVAQIAVKYKGLVRVNMS